MVHKAAVVMVDRVYKIERFSTNSDFNAVTYGQISPVPNCGGLARVLSWQFKIILIGSCCITIIVPNDYI
jgi:hypothetical protein